MTVTKRENDLFKLITVLTNWKARLLVKWFSWNVTTPFCSQSVKIGVGLKQLNHCKISRFWIIKKNMTARVYSHWYRAWTLMLFDKDGVVFLSLPLNPKWIPCFHFSLDSFDKIVNQLLSSVPLEYSLTKITFWIYARVSVSELFLT